MQENKAFKQLLGILKARKYLGNLGAGPY